VTRVLLTGATGFVGRALCECLAAAGYRVRAALRTAGTLPPGAAESVVTGSLGSANDWSSALEGVELVVHAAALTHVMRATAATRLQYAEVNAAGTGRLAQAAAAAGVRRFVFLSSIKVNGEESSRAYRADDPADPRDQYAHSKLDGENLLRRSAAASGMDAVIVRPPLVYGPGVRANFLRLMRWVDRGRPLPFGAIHNQRSLVNVWNLSDLIAALLAHQSRVEGVYLVSDGEDLSTPELMRRLGQALRRNVRLLPFPVGVLRIGAALAGRRAEMGRLCGTLTVDIAATRALPWSPPVSIQEALARTAAWYRAESR
jgi:UDP-N-acetyl-alpha-D-quinovosamine dehydrogenase